MNAWHGIAIAALLLAAWLGRYNIEAVGSDGRAVAFIVDRWTGDYYMAWPQGYRPLRRE